MKWIIRLVLLVIALFIGGMIAGYFRPAMLTVERSIQIDAQPFDVFPYLNDLTQHELWTHWAQIDPDMQIVYGGPGAGVGQRMVWKSDHPRVGNGSEIIMESVEGSFVRTQLEHSGEAVTGTYALIENDTGGVTVLMGLETHLGGFPYIQRLFASSVDSQTGQEFERALDNLKGLIDEVRAEED